MSKRDDIVTRLRTDDASDDLLISAASLLETDDDEIESLRAEVARLEQAIKVQASAAITGMNAATAISSNQLEQARRLHAASNPDALESERAMNASLTADVERLEGEVERLTAERDSPRNRCPQCDQLRLELGEARAKIANLVRWQEEAVRNCAQRRCGRRDARIVELEADLLAQINTNIEVGGLLDAAIARVEAAEKNAGRMREFLLAFINGGVNQDFRLWASEVLSDMEGGK